MQAMCSRIRGPRSPALARLLILAMTAAALPARAAWVATPPPTPSASLRTYAIRPGPLGPALDALAAQGGVQVAYAPDLVAHRSTRGLTGRFTPADALKRLLDGTGLAWRALGDTGFVLLPRPPAPARTVRAVALHPSTDDAPMLAPVNVSGALIGDARVQTATPVFTITAAQIEARGFGSVAEVLRNTVFATGSVQGPQEAGSFTQGAQPISLFGLGPQFTLILVDGKPVAQFGRPYNGTNNFISVANLPLSLIDHIDVMAGGGSAIYGSQAIGGVINIVTRSRLQGGAVSVRVGGYPDGGGASQRMTFAWGRERGRLHALAALEFANAEPIWGYQRPLTAGTGPQDGAAPLQAAILDYGSAATFDGYPQGFLAPPGGCDRGLYGGGTRPAGDGQYCGADTRDAWRTYSNDTRSYDGLLKLRYHASDSVRLYADAMWNWQEQRWYPGVQGWNADDLPGGVIEDADSGHILYPERTFAPEEMPNGAYGQMFRQRDVLYQADLGANGRFGDSGWTWDLYHLRSGDRSRVEEPLLIAPSADRFFGTLLGATGDTDPLTGLPLYRPDYAAFFRRVQPEQYAGFTRDVGETSDTALHATRATVGNTALFSLPGGDAGFAAIVEAGGESWREPINPLFTDGGVFEHAASSGGGSRAHAAAAFELNLPLLKPLTLDLSGRQDRYDSGRGHDSHRFTYRLGVEYRPFEALLLRGNYATSFKAPDLSSLFLSPSSYYTQVTDYYACAVDGASSCGAYIYGVRGTLLANPALQPTTAKSWTLGIAWSPGERLSLSVDYLGLAIRNEVIQQNTDLLSYDDARCLLGQLDPASARCRALTDPADGQVQRAGAGGPVTGLVTSYANLSGETVRAVFATLRYRFAPTRLGRFGLQLDYNDLLDHEFRLEAGMPSVRQLASPQASTEFKSMFTGALDWTSPGGDWTSTLYGRRLGTSPSYAATLGGAGQAGVGHLRPWVTFNWSVGYRVSRRLSFALMVDNLGNKMPPRDPSYTDAPYFNDENYDVYGREIMLQARLAFDAR
jgi:outer membrane receptor protein involved in Fe transport